MEVLADFVDDAKIRRERLGIVVAEYQRQTRAGGREAIGAPTGGGHRGNAEGGEAGEFRVMGAIFAVDDDSPLLKQRAEELGGEVGGVFDRETFIGALVVDGNVAP